MMEADGVELGLDLLVGELITEPRIGQAHGGFEPARMRPHPEGPHPNLEPGARLAGAEGIEGWRAVEHQATVLLHLRYT